MKLQLLTCALLLCLMTNVSAKTGQSRIMGSIEPLGATTLAIMVFDPETLDYVSWRETPIDEKGRFSFDYPVPEPDLVKLEAGGLSAYLYLDRPEEIRVVLRSRGDGGTVVEGSSGNRKYEDFGKLLNERNHHYFDELKQQGEAAVKAGNWEGVEGLEEKRDRHLELFEADLEAELVAMGNSSAVYGGLTFFDFHKQRRSFESAHARFASWNSESKMSRLLNRLLERAQQVDVGARAAAFELPDSTGQIFSLADYQGRWLLVDFWASWCLNCRFEMPRLAEVRARWKRKGFEILGITARDSRQAWLAAISQHQLAWPNLWDGEAQVAEVYQVTGQLPANFLIDPAGRIVGRNLTAAELNQELLKRVRD